MDERFCINCAHCTTQQESMGDMSVTRYRCAKSDAPQSEAGLSMEMRRAGNPCGPDGVMWEANNG